MDIKADKQRLRGVLLDAISLLCKSSLPVDAAFSIEATIGITISESNIVLISFKELVQPDPRIAIPEPSPSASACSSMPALRSVCSIPVPDLNSSVRMSQSAKAVSGQAESTTSVNRNVWKNANDSSMLDNASYGMPKTSSSETNLTPAKPSKTFTGLNSSQSDELTNQRRTGQWQQVSTDLPLQCLNPSMSNILTVKEETLEGDYREYERRGKEVGQSFDGGKGGVMCDEGSETWLQAVDPDVLDGSLCQDGVMSQDENQMMSDDGMQQSSAGSYLQVKGDRSFNRPSKYHRIRRRYMRQNRDTTQGRSTTQYSQSAPVEPPTPVYYTAAVQAALNNAASAVATQSIEGGAAICQICGARLSSASTLIKHIKGTHLEMSMCQCEICGEQFKWTMQLCRHRKRYHSDVLYSTPSCTNVPTTEALQYVQQSSHNMLSELSE